MKRNLIFAVALLSLASCSRYSKVMKAPQKSEMEANSHIYGEYGQPARQSKNTYANPEDANDRALKIKEIMFGKATASATETGNTSGASGSSVADSTTKGGS